MTLYGVQITSLTILQAGQRSKGSPFVASADVMMLPISPSSTGPHSGRIRQCSSANKKSTPSHFGYRAAVFGSSSRGRICLPTIIRLEGKGYMWLEGTRQPDIEPGIQETISEYGVLLSETFCMVKEVINPRNLPSLDGCSVRISYPILAHIQ